MKRFTFSGTATIQRKFEIDIVAHSYEEAEEKALALLEEDVEDTDFFELNDDEIEIDIDEVEEENISTIQTRYRFKDREEPVA